MTMMMVSMAGVVRMHHVGTWFFFFSRARSTYKFFPIRSDGSDWGKNRWKRQVIFPLGHVSSKTHSLYLLYFHFRRLCLHIIKTIPIVRQITLRCTKTPKSILSFLGAQEDKIKGTNTTSVLRKIIYDPPPPPVAGGGTLKNARMEYPYGNILDKFQSPPPQQKKSRKHSLSDSSKTPFPKIFFEHVDFFFFFFSPKTPFFRDSFMIKIFFGFSFRGGVFF